LHATWKWVQQAEASIGMSDLQGFQEQDYEIVDEVVNYRRLRPQRQIQSNAQSSDIKSPRASDNISPIPSRGDSIEIDLIEDIEPSLHYGDDENSSEL
jgi:hypothetical protein